MIKIQLMKRTSFYSYAVPLGGIGMMTMDYEEMYRKEVILKNSFATKNNISKMKLEVSRIVAVNEHGDESSLINFKSGVSFTLDGMYTGEYIRTKWVQKLDAGKYTHFRMYLRPEMSKYFGSDGEVRPVYQEMLDFEIEGALVVDSEKSPELVMRFDLPPFESTGFIRWIEDSFKSLSNLKVGGLKFPSSQGA